MSSYSLEPGRSERRSPTSHHGAPSSPSIQRTPLPISLGKADTVVDTKQSVEVCGLVESVRSTKWGGFLTLRDHTGGRLQLVISSNVSSLPCLGASMFAEGQIVSSNAKAGFEMQVERIRITSSPRNPLPISLTGRPEEGLDHRLDNRAASLRNSMTRAIFAIQHEVTRTFREVLEAHEFVEIHSPKIVGGGTEGGAEVFALDYFGRQASLAQSPQLYKQIGAGAFGRVFEIGPVFRAENSRTSRHLTEFTGLDFEMAFIRSVQDVMDVEETLLRAWVKNVSEQPRAQAALNELGIELPVIVEIPRINYTVALEWVDELGTKPTERNLDQAMSTAIETKTGSPVAFVYGYPAEERPFYTMLDPDRPGYTLSFDLIYRGLEISSGAQRIHDLDELQARMAAKGLDPDRYPGYMDAFKCGMPPHGGGGMGLERITQTLLGLGNVREATMFPRDIGRLDP